MMKWSSQTATTLMERSPELYKLRDIWSYDYGVVLKGFLRLYELTDDIRYFNYIKRNMDHFIDEKGDIKTYFQDDYNIDYVNNGKLLFILYEKTKNTKYRIAADTLYQQLQKHPRTEEGAFWHKKVYPHQIWLDGLYMGTPFYAEYIQKMLKSKNYQDVLNQFQVSYRHLKDESTGLLFHAWDEKKMQPWSDEETGLSHTFWSRSIGWYLMAIVDVCEILQIEGIECTVFSEMLEGVLESLVTYQNPDSHVWYQVTNQMERKQNYLEASGSSMFVYAMAKGIRLGMLDSEKWLDQMNNSFNGLIQEFVLLTKQGWVNLNKNCEVAGLGGEPRRDGTFAYYISEPIISNDLKGVGAFLQAAIEVEELNNEN